MPPTRVRPKGNDVDLEGGTMPTYLIVANQTLGGAELLDEVRELAAAGPCDFHLVVPATAPKEHLTWSEGEARTIAARRLEEGLAHLRGAGITVDGEVGDASPVMAVDDALRHRTVDRVIVCTLPIGMSRWLKLSLPDRIERKHKVPVTHLVIQPEASRAT
jgi:GABA permease